MNITTGFVVTMWLCSMWLCGFRYMYFVLPSENRCEQAAVMEGMDREATIQRYFSEVMEE